MKRLLATTILFSLLLSGCSNWEDAFKEGSEAVENLTNEAIEVKTNVETKIQQVKDATESVNEAVEAVNQAKEDIGEVVGVGEDEEIPEEEETVTEEAPAEESVAGKETTESNE